jgi:hypothetical protein
MKKLLMLLCGFSIGMIAMLTEEERQQKEVLLKWMRGAPIQEIQSIKEAYSHLFRPDDQTVYIMCNNDSEVSEHSEKD